MSAIVGRDRELEAIASMLDLDPGGARILLLEGEAGIGKTTVWRAAVDEARHRDFRVLAHAAARSETRLSFTGLRDLAGDVFDEVAEELPGPQRHAVDVVLLREESTGAPLEPETIAVAFLTMLRALAARGPTLLAVDDVQWLDPVSATPLGYALRRLGPAPLAVLLSRRTDEDEAVPLALDGLDRECVQVLPLDQLSIGALGRILHARLGVAYSRPTLRRVYDVSHGNPFFALELARALDPARPLAPGEAIPVPGTLRELVRGRLEALPDETLEALSIAASLSQPTVAVVGAVLGADPLPPLRPALNDQVVELEGETIRFAHPLFAAAVSGRAEPASARRLHGRLAAVVDDAEERARHLALATEVPDEDVAAVLEDAARRTRARGDRGVCAELYEAAARLTPDADASARTRRLLAAAGAVFEAGDSERAQNVLEAILDDVGERSEGDEARWRLGNVLAETGREERAMQLWREALAATDDAALTADIRRSMAVETLYAGDPAEAIEHADGAVAAAEASADLLRLAYALSTRALAAAVIGDPAYRTFAERALALEASVEAPCSAWSPRAVVADCARLALDLEEADRQFRILLEQAVETGNAEVEQWAAYGLAMTQLLVGDHRSASELARVVHDLAESTGMMRLPEARLRAELDAHTGRVETARDGLRAVMADAERLGQNRFLWQAKVSLGLLELSEGDAASAADALRDARWLADTAGMRHAAVLCPLVDEVEAAALAGRHDQAEEARAAARAFPDAPAWGESLLLRADAAVLASRGELNDAETALERALELHPPSFVPLQRGRTLLMLGSVRRRLRRRRAARDTLQQALAVFEELECAPWAERARDELARIGGRPPSTGELTPAEQRVAELVAEGKTNKEVAAILVVADRTVESALTQIYRKLEVRSRTELARKVAGSR